MLSRSAEYGLRIMAYLALQNPEKALRAQDIANQVNIPIFYLSKILRRMVEAELLSATKGHGGGFIIARPANKIRVCDILEAIEGAPDRPKCVFGWDICSDKNPCILHHRWIGVRSHFETWTKETSLADVKSDVAKLGISHGSGPLKKRVRKKKSA